MICVCRSYVLLVDLVVVVVGSVVVEMVTSLVELF